MKQLDDMTVQTDIVQVNPTGGDGSGARAVQLILQGTTAGSVLHTLAALVASHEGTGADQKGQLKIYTNAGSDGTSPTLFATISAGQLLTLVHALAIGSGGTGATTAYGALDALMVAGANIASGATTDLSAATGLSVTVTGNVTITALGTDTDGVLRFVTFSGTPTLTHNGTSLILPGAANIVAAAGDIALFQSLGSGNWKCLFYVRAAAVPQPATLAAVATSGSAADLVGGTLAAARLPAFTGDATASAGSSALTIPAGTVTNAKQANMATATMKGRLTAGTGAPEDLTMLQSWAMLTGQAAALTAPSGLLGLVFAGAVPQNATTALRYTGFGAGLTVGPIPLGWKFLLLALTASCGAAGLPPSGQSCSLKLYVDTVDQSANHGSLVIDNTHSVASAEVSVPGTPYVIDASGAIKSVEVKSVNTATTGTINLVVTLFGILIRA